VLWRNNCGTNFDIIYMAIGIYVIDNGSLPLENNSVYGMRHVLAYGSWHKYLQIASKATHPVSACC